KYFKNINLLGNIADIVSNTIDTVEQQNTTVTSKEMILSGFVLPELLEDEVLTQFDDEKNNNDILNVKLGISFANKHISTDISSYLDIDIFLNNS
ncbi:MAG: hypothetical protein PHP14_03500, partial [Candidatus Pacebacteria bacterium]|nr:hypothetical protein [Candidatus Paceibacterota bacterium]